MEELAVSVIVDVITTVDDAGTVVSVTVTVTVPPPPPPRGTTTPVPGGVVPEVAVTVEVAGAEVDVPPAGDSDANA